MNQQLLFLLTGMGGLVFHILIKLKSLSDDSYAANIEFKVWRDYFVRDRFGIAAAFLAPFVWLLLFGEAAAKYPALQGFAYTSFFVMGAIGSWVLQLILGKSKKAIRKVVDEKTDIADRKTSNENL